MRNPHGEFIWYELITPDPDGAKSFYDAVMGWEVGPPHDDIGYREIKSGAGHAGGVLPLTADMAEHGARPIWLGYVGVDDVDSAVADVEQAGGKVLMPARDIPDVGRFAMLADPQGVPFYAMRGAIDAPSTAFSPTEEGRCGWNELATSDPASAVDFYMQRFGWAKGEAMPMGDMGDYQIVNHGGRHIGAIMKAGEGMGSRWRFYFRVGDVDEAKRAVDRGGGTVLHGPQEVPGGERILIGRDPQGAEFALVGK